jgi:hypothetical protein
MTSITIPRGYAVSIKFNITEPIKSLAINYADETNLLAYPSLFMSINGEIMQDINYAIGLITAAGDLVTIRIDCTRLHTPLVVDSILLNDIVEPIDFETVSNLQMFTEETVVKAVDLAMFTSAVVDTQLALIHAAELSNAWSIDYYQAKHIKQISIINATSLKSITEVKALRGRLLANNSNEPACCLLRGHENNTCAFR